MTSVLPLQPLRSHPLIIGVGNAGINFLDRLLLTTPSFPGLIALNNDPENLTASVVSKQYTLSPDSELITSFEEIKGQLAEEIKQAPLILLCGGLGGSVASSLVPEIAALAKGLKKTVISCVSLPFIFEGKRAQTLALESLSALEKNCDGIVVLDNNALCSTHASKNGLGETFAASDEAMQTCLPALLAMFLNKGPVRIARTALTSALKRSGIKTHFGYGQAEGPTRVHQALERAFKSPLLERGRFLAKAETIFILLRGPKDFSFAEAQVAMQEVERFASADHHDIQLSILAEEPVGTPLKLFILAVTQGASPRKKESVEKIVPLIQKEPLTKSSEISIEKETIVENPKISPKPVETRAISSFNNEKIAKELFPIDSYESPIDEAISASAKSASLSKPKQTQGALNLTAAQRGRFDKSEPTIVEGEDLDTPTYLRWGLKLG